MRPSFYNFIKNAVNILRYVRGQTIYDELKFILNYGIAILLSFLNKPPIAIMKANLKVADWSVIMNENQNLMDILTMVPWYEKEVRKIMRALLRYGDTYVDVGANIGTHVIYASRFVGFRGSVIAIEPIPEAVSVLKSIVSLNKLFNVKIYPFAIYSKCGIVRMSYHPSLTAFSKIDKKRSTSEGVHSR